MTGHAVPSYGPALPVEFFKKLECFAKQSLVRTKASGCPWSLHVNALLARSRRVHERFGSGLQLFNVYLSGSRSWRRLPPRGVAKGVVTGYRDRLR